MDFDSGKKKWEMRITHTSQIWASCRISFVSLFLRLNLFALCDRSLIAIAEKKTAIARKQTFLSSNPSSVLLFFLVLCKLVSFDTLPDGRASHSRLYIYINIFRCIGVKWCERFVCASSTILLYCAHYFSYQRSMFMCLVVKKNTYCYSVFKFIVSWFYDHKELLISAKSSVRFCNLRIVKLIRKRLARATHQGDAVGKKASVWLYFAGV